MNLISIIEDDGNYTYNELTLLNKELNVKINKNKPTFTSNIEYQGYCSCKASSKCKKAKKVEKINKDNAIQVEALKSGNIDDIMKYICSDDHKKKKKKKNKNKCKDNNNNNSIHNDNCTYIYGNVNNNINEDDDIMVINFKNSLLNNSFKAYQYNKIIPSLSEGWLYSLNNNTNNILLNNIINNNTHDTNTTNLI
jgi:hypothetical protein